MGQVSAVLVPDRAVEFAAVGECGLCDGDFGRQRRRTYQRGSARSQRRISQFPQFAIRGGQSERGARNNPAGANRSRALRGAFSHEGGWLVSAERFGSQRWQSAGVTGGGRERQLFAGIQRDRTESESAQAAG